MDDEQRIRERAHAIWEAEGRPDGCEKEHWQRACHELGVSVVAGDGAGPSLGSSPVTPISGHQAQEEPPYAGIGPTGEHSG
ncbi:MAG TPA: DUF2934 domain-containing protein [Rhizomicrobium sp.]|nr:DUF2934 domain-containing protein [Rhizomicrobium sp.]